MSDDLENAREVLSAYDELVDGLRAENARLREALEGLVNTRSTPTPPTKGVWPNDYVHGGRYDGPTYVEVLARARAALATVTAPAKSG